MKWMSNYRDGVMPARKLHSEDVWDKVMDKLEVEPLRSPTTSSSKDRKATTSMATTTLARSGGAEMKRSILDLPLETQKDIFRYVCIAMHRFNDEGWTLGAFEGEANNVFRLPEPTSSRSPLCRNSSEILRPNDYIENFA